MKRGARRLASRRAVAQQQSFKVAPRDIGGLKPGLSISRAVGKGKTVVWHWQERFMHEGVEGLTRDKTRPSRIPPLPAVSVNRVVALTNQVPPHEATHWTALAMAKAVGISPSSVRHIWKRHGLQPHRVRSFKLSNDPQFAEKLKPNFHGFEENGC
jgi:hypothetical protein